MFKDLIIIPNFFDNPEQIVNISKSNAFYAYTEHPEDKSTQIYYGGKRSEQLNEYANNILSETFIKKVVLSNIPKDALFNVEYVARAYFHYFPKEYLGGKSEIHQDSGFLSGVIYLNDVLLESPNDHGTIVFNENNDSFIMPYTFNTLIMYRSDYNHAPLAGFGNDAIDGRLSLIFNVKKLKLEISRETLS